jgi:SAM-dependent methyltransferase
LPDRLACSIGNSEQDGASVPLAIQVAVGQASSVPEEERPVRIDDLPHDEAETKNRALWDEIAPVHFDAYREVALLRQGAEILDEIELREIGDVRGRTMLHLQCHIGTDTLAWERHGAIVTGLDFSSESIACAERLKAELGLHAWFVHANVYDARSVVDERFDLVYTSRGVLCWLRDLEEWGRIVAHFLKPGGVFYLMESHPILNALEERPSGELSFAHGYFHRSAPTVWADQGADYASDYVPRNPSYEWTWTVGDVVNALVGAGLRIELLNEYDRLFFRLFPGMESEDGRWFRLPALGDRLPLLLTIRARKPE